MRRKRTWFTAVILAAVCLCIGCNQDHIINSTPSSATIDIAAIAGVTPPATGGVPVEVITATAQYTGTVAWNLSPSDSTFAVSTVYIATITLTAKTGYTFDGVKANFFTVAGAQNVTNPAGSGIVTAIFPATADLSAITITTQPEAVTNVNEGSITGSLSVAAAVSGGGTPAYQWYQNIGNSTTGGTTISGATGTSFAIPDGLTSGTYYYFCEVRASGAASKRSNVAVVTVTGSTSAPVITINTQPAAATGVVEGSITGSLTVEAAVSGGGTPAYQWYYNTDNNTTGGTEINGAANASFAIPDMLTSGTYYYFCQVSANGAASKYSNVVEVTVTSNPSASVITITTQPAASTTVTEGTTTVVLTVAASVSGGGTPMYQWYYNTGNSTTGATEIEGRTGASLTISTIELPEMVYFFCKVSADGAVPKYSNVAVVIVPGNHSEPEITITTQPAVRTTVNEGSISGSLSVTATVTGWATLYYQWYEDGAAVSEVSTNGKFTLPTTLTEGGHYYYCEVTAEGADTVVSNTAVVMVNQSLPSSPLALSPDVWKDGDIPSSGVTEQWFTFTATAEYQYIHARFGTLEDVYVQLYDSVMTTVGNRTRLSSYSSTKYIFQSVNNGETYYIKVTPYGSDSGNYWSGNYWLLFNTSPTPPIPVINITTQPAPATTVTQGGITGSLTVSATVTEGAVLSYQWYSINNSYYYDGTAIPGATNASFAIPTTLTIGTYYYYCVVSADAADSKYSDKVTVRVNQSLPSLPVTLSPAAWKDGNIPSSGVTEQWFTFTATAAYQYIHARFGTLNYLYVQLYDSVMNMVGAGTNLYSYSSTKYISRSVNNGETYYIKVTPAYSGYSGNYRISFNESATPPASVITITTQPENTTVTAGKITGSLTVGAEVTDDATLSYQWHNSETGLINGATHASYTIPVDLTAGTYSYYCQVSATYGAVPVSTNTVTVTVNESTDVEFVIKLSYLDEPNLIEQYAFAAAGTDTPFTVSGTGYTEYQWYINGEKDANAAASTYTLNRSAGSYELAVVVSNAAGIQYSGSCHVTVR